MEQMARGSPLSRRLCYLYIDFPSSLTAALWGGVIFATLLCRPVLVTVGVRSGVVDVVEIMPSCSSVDRF